MIAKYVSGAEHHLLLKRDVEYAKTPYSKKLQLALYIDMAVCCHTPDDHVLNFLQITMIVP